MKIAFLTLGCKLNYAETSTYERGFKAAGLEVVPWNEKADIYLVNTCSVTAVSDRKSRNLVRRVHRVNPEAMVVVTGCSAELRRGEIEGIEGVTRVFGANEKTLVAYRLTAQVVVAYRLPAAWVMVVANGFAADLQSAMRNQVQPGLLRPPALHQPEPVRSLRPTAPESAPAPSSRFRTAATTSAHIAPSPTHAAAAATCP